MSEPITVINCQKSCYQREKFIEPHKKLEKSLKKVAFAKNENPYKQKAK